MDCLGYNISSARNSQLGRANPPQLIQNWENQGSFKVRPYLSRRLCVLLTLMI